MINSKHIHWIMWETIIIIILVVLVYIYYNHRDLFPELNNTINQILNPGKRGNLFPPLSKTAASTIPGHPDQDFGTGWTGSAGTFRMPAAIMTSTNTPNPSGDPFYFYLALCGDILSATISNLVIGRSYQLSGYILCIDDAVFRVTMDDHILIPKMSQIPTTTFVTFGPITAQAFATSHMIHFCNDSVPITGPNVLMGNFIPIIITGLLFEWAP